MELSIEEILFSIEARVELLSGFGYLSLFSANFSI